MPTIHERLATLETQQSVLSSDVTEIKGDVKTLVAYMVAEQAIKAQIKEQSQFRRWLAPILISLGNVAVTLFNFLGVFGNGKGS